MTLALLGPDWDKGFRDDRQAIFADVDFNVTEPDLQPAMAQFRAHAALLDAQLSDGRLFLTGNAPRLADIQAFGVPWFTRDAMPVTKQLLGTFSHLPAWEARVAELGEGERRAIAAGEAHAVARDHSPDLGTGVDPDEPQQLACRSGSNRTISQSAVL